MYLYVLIPLVALCFMNSAAEELLYRRFNVTRTAPGPFAAYRSALTLDWMAAEDSRQREMAVAFETLSTHPFRRVSLECVSYPKPSPYKVARLLLELLRSLEGDEGILIPDLIQALIKTKLLLVETSIFEAEPDLETLVKTPRDMLGEPLSTFPRIMAVVWLSVTDPVTRKHGWCAVNKVAHYLSEVRPNVVAKNMKALEPILARARFIMEEFIQQVTPLNMMNRPTPTRSKGRHSVKNYEEDDAQPPVKINNKVYTQAQEDASIAQNQDKLEDSHHIASPNLKQFTTRSLHLVDANGVSMLGYNRSLRLCYNMVTIVLTMLIFL